MASRAPRLTAREIEAILSRHGFELISQKGSHRKWRRRELSLQVIVPEHLGRQLPVGTVRSILVHAEIPREEWKP
ncbi:MAG TPA: type II toxin-antitoxin system HicA family toxin [Sumerlaeia bacterium]|nr:type II toxin-antitoxin system HicA family toxin [Sumerlaeia bacterium]